MTRARDLADLASSGVIEGTEVADDAITYAKIQNVSADERILGRVSGADGVVEELTKAQMLTMMNVEDGSTADQSNSEIKAAVEAASDSNTFTDADHSKLDGVASSANNYTHPNHSGEVTSTNDGATVVVDNIVDEANLKISNAGSNGEFLSKQSGNTGGLTWAAASSVGGATGVDFNDNVKTRFGTGNDLEIYHNGSASFIDETGTGTLAIRGAGNVEINSLTNESMANFINDGAVELFHNSAKKLETVSGGATITGVCTATSFAGDGSNLTGISAGASLSGSTDNQLVTVTGSNAMQGESMYTINSSDQYMVNTTSEIANGSGDMMHVLLKSNTSYCCFKTQTNSMNIFTFVNIYDIEKGSVSLSQTSVSYSSASDYRLKENEVALPDSIERLKQLKPYRFNWKELPEETAEGFFAHEVESIFPDAITGEKDAIRPEVLYTADEALPEGKNIGDVKHPERIKPQQMDYGKITPLLTAALQQAITKIETLEAKVTALENA